MKKSVRILSLLLALILVLSAFTVCAFASGEPESSASESESEEVAEEMKPIEVKFTTENFLEALNYLWQGMLCIFIVIGVLVLVTYALNKITNTIANKKSEGNE